MAVVLLIVYSIVLEEEKFSLLCSVPLKTYRKHAGSLIDGSVKLLKIPKAYPAFMRGCDNKTKVCDNSQREMQMGRNRYE